MARQDIAHGDFQLYPTHRTMEQSGMCAGPCRGPIDDDPWKVLVGKDTPDSRELSFCSEDCCRTWVASENLRVMDDEEQERQQREWLNARVQQQRQQEEQQNQGEVRKQETGWRQYREPSYRDHRGTPRTVQGQVPLMCGWHKCRKRRMEEPWRLKVVYGQEFLNVYFCSEWHARRWLRQFYRDLADQRKKRPPKPGFFG